MGLGSLSQVRLTLLAKLPGLTQQMGLAFLSSHWLLKVARRL